MLQGLIDSILQLSAVFVTPDWGALVALIPGAASVLYRQFFPNAGRPAPKAPSNGGVAS